MLEAKTCSRCKEIKPVVEFYKDSRRKGGLQSACKQCIKAYERTHKKEKAEYQTAYYLEHKEERAEQRKKHYLEHKEELAEKQKKWYRANKEAIAKNKKKYTKQRRKIDPLFKITCNLRRHARRTKSKFGLKSKTAELLGCSFEFVQAYLIQTAISNYGSYSDAPNAYEIDHILPLSSAKTEAEAISFGHYSNLQYLTPAHNREKAGKLGWQLPQKLLDFPT